MAEVAGETEEMRLIRELADFALVADWMEPASDLSGEPLSARDRVEIEPLGLSFFSLFAPGILERIEPRIERAESRVSVREKDG